MGFGGHMNIFVNKLMFIVVMLILGIALLWIGFRLFFILIPFAIAFGLSKPLSWLVDKIKQKTHLPRSLISLVVVIIFIGLLITAISFGVYKGVQALRGISTLLSTVAENIESLTKQADLIVFELPWYEAPIALSDLLFDFYDVFLSALTQLTNGAIDIIVSVAKALPSIGIFIFMLLISLYFLTRDHEKVVGTVSHYGSKIKFPWLIHLKENSFETIKQYLKAQLIIISITYLISFIGLTIMGIPFSYLIAAAVAFIDLIPMVGPAFIYMPWIVLVLMMSEYSTALGLFIIYLISTLTRQTLEPRIVSSKIGTHPLIMLFSMYTCYRFIGISGLILGPILVMITLVAIRVYESVFRNTNINA